MKFIPQEPSIKMPFLWGAGAVFCAVGVLAIFWLRLPPEVPIFFSRPRGEAQLGPTFMLLIPLVIAFSMLFINSILSQRLTSYPLLRRMITLGATTSCILASITVIRIIFLVL